MTPSLHAQLRAAKRSIIPVCINKKPLVQRWKPFQERHATDPEFHAWEAKTPPAWAVITGRLSGVVVLDFDGLQGVATMRKLELDPHIRTGSGGYHVWVEHPGWRVPTLNAKTKLELNLAFPGMDIRGDGGYAVCEGRNESGAYQRLRPLDALYRWQQLDARILPFIGRPAAVDEQTRRKQAPPVTAATGARVDAERLVRQALDRAGTDGRNNAGFGLALQLRDNGYSQAEAMSSMGSYVGRVLTTNLKGQVERYSRTEAGASVREAYRSPAREPWDAPGAGAGAGSAPAPPAPPPVAVAPDVESPPPDYLRNETGNADRLFARFGDDLAHCEQREGYMVWTGTAWRFDRFVVSERMAEKTMLDAFPEAVQLRDEKDRANFLKFVSGSLSRKGLANMAHLAKKKVRQMEATGFDTDPFLLNCQNGTVDLRSGELRPHRREDFLSKLIPIEYDPAAQCPLFLRFIYWAMGDHVDASPEQVKTAGRLVDYLQRLFGCAATGKPEKLLVVLYGRGDNGKSTLVEIITKALGEQEYSTPISVDSLMLDPRGGISNATNADLSDMQGCRFVSCSEVKARQRLSLARVKYLTGLTVIKTRRLRENWISFRPTWKIFMDCNHRPVITDPTDAIWNRVKCVPFLVQISETEKDTDLPYKLEAELPGILAWIVAGAKQYVARGLGTAPPEVIASTAEYREDSDRLKNFIEDCCCLHPHAWVSSDELTKTYLQWCEKTGERWPLGTDEFKEQIKSKGCVAKRGYVNDNQTRGWVGIKVVNDCK